jgi:hypothetical protein
MQAIRDLEARFTGALVRDRAPVAVSLRADPPVITQRETL